MVYYTATVTFGVANVTTKEDLKKVHDSIEETLKRVSFWGWPVSDDLRWSVRRVSKLTKVESESREVMKHKK